MSLKTDVRDLGILSQTWRLHKRTDPSRMTAP